MNKLTLVCVIAFASCTLSKNEWVGTESDTTASKSGWDYSPDDFLSIENYNADRAFDSTLFEVIDSACAVFIFPTEEQLTELENEHGPDELATIIDDNEFFLYEAMASLDSAGIRTKKAEKGLIRFTGRRKSWDLDIRQPGAPHWNLILFHPSQQPIVVLAVDLTQKAIKEYYYTPEQP